MPSYIVDTSSFATAVDTHSLILLPRSEGLRPMISIGRPEASNTRAPS